jgi:hypothetical protein
MATVKAINEKFSPEEFSLLTTAKGSMSWHDFILDKCVPKKKKSDPFEVDLGEEHKSIW